MKSVAGIIDFCSQSKKLWALEGLLARKAILGYTVFGFYFPPHPLFFNKSNAKVEKRTGKEGIGFLTI